MPSIVAAPPLALAINPTRVGKMTKQNTLREWRVFNDGFNNLRCDTQHLLDMVRTGHSFSACHSHIHRKMDPWPDGTERESSFRCAQNWLPTSIIALDFDKAHKGLQEMWAIPLVGEHACFAYTTTSSTPEEPHVRVVWSLPKTVQRVENYRLILAAMADEFLDADRASKDPVKAYAGNHLPSFSYLERSEARIPLSVIDLIVAHHKERVSQREAERAAHDAELRRQYGELPEREWSVADVREMLACIPPEPGFDDWTKALMAVHSIFPDEIGIGLCEEWSPGKPGEVRYKWRTFRQGDPNAQGSISIKWLIVVAGRYGYRPSTNRDDRVRSYIASAVHRR